MGFFLEILFEILFETVLQVVFEVLAEAGLHACAQVFRKREERNPIWAGIGYALLGLGVGGLSLLIFPQSLIHRTRYHGASLILTPLLGGMAMSAVGWIRRRKGESLIRLDTFSSGFIFAFGMALIRFLFTQ